MTEKPNGLESVGRNLKWLGILTALLGLFILAAPLMTGISLVILIGCLVLAGGIMRLLAALRGESAGFAPILTGILTILCGLVMVLDPILASGVLSVLIAVYLIFDGVSEMAAAWRIRPAVGWGWLMTMGTLSLLLGIMIWRQFPLSGAWAMGFALGFKLLFIGLGMAGVGRTVQKSTD
jgi:uncharacterized membrane protein HdeD (DUF308 family)